PGQELTSGWSFRREILGRAGSFDERLIRNQDNEYTCRIARLGGRVYFAPRARCFYYARTRVAAFLKLMFRNGFYHMLTWRVSPESFHPLHCVPAVFVTVLVLLVIMSRFTSAAVWGLTAVLGVYAVAVLATTVS